MSFFSVRQTYKEEEPDYVWETTSVTVDYNTANSATQQSSNNIQTTTPANNEGRIIVFPDTVYSPLLFLADAML